MWKVKELLRSAKLKIRPLFVFVVSAPPPASNSDAAYVALDYGSNVLLP